MAWAYETTVREVYEAANRRDMDAILARTHEDVEVRPVLGANLGANVYRGHAGIAGGRMTCGATGTASK